MKTKQAFGYAAKLIKGDRYRFLLIFIGVILASVVISALFSAYTAYEAVVGDMGGVGIISQIRDELDAGHSLSDNEPLMMKIVFIAIFLAISMLSMRLTICIYNVYVINNRKNLMTMLCLGADRRSISRISAAQAIIVSAVSALAGNIIGIAVFAVFSGKIGEIIEKNLVFQPKILPYVITDIALIAVCAVAMMLSVRRICGKYPVENVPKAKKIKRKKRRISVRNRIFHIANARVSADKKEKRSIVLYISLSLMLLMCIMQQRSCFEKSAVKKELAKNFDVSVSFRAFESEDEFISEIKSAAVPYYSDMVYAKSCMFIASGREKSFGLYLTGIDDGSFASYAERAEIEITESAAMPCILLSAVSTDGKYSDVYGKTKRSFDIEIGNYTMSAKDGNGEAVSVDILGASDEVYIGQFLPVRGKNDETTVRGVVPLSCMKNAIEECGVPHMFDFTHMYFVSADEEALAKIVGAVAERCSVDADVSERKLLVKERSNTRLIGVVNVAAALLIVFAVLSIMNVLGNHFASGRGDLETLSYLGIKKSERRSIIVAESLIYAAESCLIATIAGYVAMILIYLLNVNVVSDVGFSFDPLVKEVVALPASVFIVVMILQLFERFLNERRL